MESKYINDKVYTKVAEDNSVPVATVEFVMGYVSNVMAKTITSDDPTKSVKLDYLGNLYSKDKQREKIAELDEKKNGRPADTSR